MKIAPKRTAAHPTPARAIASLGAGAILGSCLGAPLVIAPDFIRDPAYFTFQPTGAAFILVGAFFVYAVGLLLFGAPAWMILHALNLRSWRAAMALGLVLNGGVILLFVQPFVGSATLPPVTETGAVEAAVAFAAVGACVGLSIWRVAYPPSRSRTSDGAEAFD